MIYQEGRIQLPSFIIHTLIIVFRMRIFLSRFLIVTLLTERLPIAPIPEEFMISSMRDDMVNNRCLHVPAFLHALHTQRVHLKVLLSGLTPSSSVASSGSGPYLFRMLSRMFIAVFSSPWHKPGTARVSTGVIRCPWHPFFLLSKKPRGLFCP